MAFSVDVDEADIAVLSENLQKSKSLFDSLSKSLHKISNKADTASKKISPVLYQVNQLNDKKIQLEQGISLLIDVQENAAEADGYELLLNAKIEEVGIKKYLSSMIQAKQLLKKMKETNKKFKGVQISLQNSIEKGEFSMITYFKRLVAQQSGARDLSQYVAQYQLQQQQQQQQQLQFAPTHISVAEAIPAVKLKEMGFILDYYHNLHPDDTSLDKEYIKHRLQYLVESLTSIDKITMPPAKTNNNNKIPYEKGSNGVSPYSKILGSLMETEYNQIQELNSKSSATQDRIDINHGLFEIFGRVVNEKYSNSITQITRYVEGNMTTDSLLALETVTSVKDIEKMLYKLINTTGIHTVFKPFLNTYTTLKSLCQTIFNELLRFIEVRISALEKLPNDNGVSEVTVELMSRIRKISDFRELCLEVISSMKLGAWMMQTPKPKSISVFLSVLPNLGDTQDEHDANFLLSSYFSDCIDSILINLEIIAKQGDLRIAKKSVQGYFLITNLTLVEQIVNRSSELYKSLGSIGLERLQKLKKRFLVLFLDDWNYASYIIIRDMTTITATHAATTATSGGSSSTPKSHVSVNHTPNNKEKEQIKELFKTFNESFEDAVSNYKNFNITDQNLRSYLTNEIKKLIMNTYFKLYDKYGTVDFTKNRSKYVKYDKKSFEDVLNNTL